ncbi:Por secretion system C-terminal sorting domain-containing protein [Lutibacter oricola]|uniref:Por secretion system C-terminal sorting domain-containing protein n=1 Tax=Lutibacter oricola TaxID=762486 RepID=A0A1H2WH19_9FLAO|nr:T9SS type A sorting domain-containing protein [Lutibacter oricola]SDW79808.1 Por secretion system C-terminal sorting domain-containing protein [Lutibacter oricola]
MIKKLPLLILICCFSLSFAKPPNITSALFVKKNQVNFDFRFNNTVKIYGNNSTIYISSKLPISTKVEVYNILGQQILSKEIIKQTKTKLDVPGYKGIAFIVLTVDREKIKKKVIL